MAINYEKVGWDTTKFVGPTNMNHMDTGIKKACDGVDALNTAMGDADISKVGDGTAKGAILELNNNFVYKEVPLSSDYHGLNRCILKRFGKNIQIIVGGTIDKDFIGGTNYAFAYTQTIISEFGNLHNWIPGTEYNTMSVCRLDFDDEYVYFTNEKDIPSGGNVYAFFNYIE